MHRRSLSALGALALLSVAGAAPAAERPELTLGPSADYDYQPPAVGSYRLPAIKAAADGAVLDHEGERRSLHELLDGRITVMAFIYTRCGDVCPLAKMLLHDLHQITAADPGLREAMQLATISFDPANDTPEVMAMEAHTLHHAGPAAPWHFLTTEGPEALRPLLDAYGQPLARRDDGFAHQLRVFLIDRDKRIRNIYSVGFLDPRMVVTDVRTLLAEERRAGADGGVRAPALRAVAGL